MNKTKLVICALLGNCFEVYDFIIYQFLAAHLASYFFNTENKYSFLLTQLIYASSIISRTLGGLFFGILADLKGRRLCLEKTILISGLSTFAIALIPPYAQIGIWASIILFLLRFMQGFSLGGEQGSSIAFLIEHSSPKNRGFITSFWCSGQNLGVLLVILATTYYSSYISSTPSVHNDSWKIFFTLSIIVSFFGYWLRKKTNETIEFIFSSKIHKITITEIILDLIKFVYNIKILLVASFLLIFLGTFMNFSIFVVTSGHLKTFADKLPLLKYIQVIMSIILVFSIPFFGSLSDKIGRKPIIIFSALLTPLLSMIIFSCIEKNNPGFNMILAAFALSVNCAAFFAVTPAFITELLPAKIRCTSFAIFYTIPAAISASITPFIAGTLIKTNSYTIAYINLVISILSVIAMYKIIEPVNQYKQLNKYNYELLKP